MSVSDSSRVQLAYIAEDEYGVKKTGSNLQILRKTGETLKQDTNVQTSSEIRSDRQITGAVRTNVNVSGQVNAELSFGTYDDLLVASLMSAGWSTTETVTASTISASAADNSFNDSGNGFGSLIAGQWIKVAGCSNSGNNGYFKIVTAAAGKITVSGGTLTDETAGSSITMTMGAQIVNGTTKTSFNIERKYTDLSNEFSLFLGCMINELGLNVALESMITGNFGMLGKTEESLSASSGSGYTAETITDVMNCVDQVLAVLEGQTSVDAKAFSLQLNNNLRARNRIGGLGAFDIGTGKCNVTGSLQAYFESKTLFDKYLNFSSTSLAIVLEDGAGNAYVVDLPSVKITDGSREAGSGDQDIIANLSWQAFKHPTEDVTIRIAKFAI